ncbi:MAG: hypothetical protein ABNO52_00055 [Candidatus Shikimatogenerans sp. Tser]|uniref:Uncharacterized protein n=1 Tax=Candidatus Shikimatogenerans sp. Tser TaxID=3158568 RepID=A0AAU7QQF1_9FLAO
MFNIKNIEKISINKIKKYFNYKSLKIKYFYTNYNFNIKDNKIYQFLRIGYFFYNKNIFYKIFNFKKNIFYKK